MDAKTKGAIQELEETIYRPGRPADAGIAEAERLVDLPKGADELRAILVAGVKTPKARRDKWASSLITVSYQHLLKKILCFNLGTASSGFPAPGRPSNPPFDIHLRLVWCVTVGG